ncbi:MAG: META domain-containing protein [Paracoccus sp. (in: a-proteobacteria)]
MKPWIVPLIFLAACAYTQLPEDQRIDGIDWKLTEMDGLPWPDDVSLRINGNRLTGVGPCNAYSGRQVATIPSFSITNLHWTNMPCADPQRKQAEGLYNQQLMHVEWIRRDGARLILTGSGANLIFEMREARGDEVF